MKGSRSQQKRKAKLEKRQVQTKLNLISLMDIFTILVFFLMVNSGEVKVVQDKSIKLPDSSAEKMPAETLVVFVNDRSLLVQGRNIADISQLKSDSPVIINALKEELDHQSKRRPSMTDSEQITGRPITIMGDKQVPYNVLKRILATCAETDYRQVSLAVNRIIENESGASTPATAQST